MQTAMHKLFVVEDHALVRRSYALLFARAAGLELCGEAASAEEALETLPRIAPDLVLVDLSLPNMSGIELIEQLRARSLSLRTLIVTGHDGEFYQHQALQAGADGFVKKCEGPNRLLETIYATLNEQQTSLPASPPV